MSRVVLLTGFAPFAGSAGNPSWDAVDRVAREWPADAADRVLAVRLPVEFDAAAAAVRAAIDEHAPDVVIATGLAAGRSAVTPERIAINVDDARIPDESGATPVDRAIEPDGPDGRFSTLPVKAIVQGMRDAGIPAGVSNTAGTFVCNRVMYEVLAALEPRPGARGGFVHVPATPAIALGGEPTLEPDEIARAIRAAVEATLATRDDIPLADGAIS